MTPPPATPAPVPPDMNATHSAERLMLCPQLATATQPPTPSPADDPLGTTTSMPSQLKGSSKGNVPPVSTQAPADTPPSEAEQRELLKHIYHRMSCDQIGEALRLLRAHVAAEKAKDAKEIAWLTKIVDREQKYLKEMDSVIDEAGVFRSCINPLEDLRRAVYGLRDDLAKTRDDLFYTKRELEANKAQVASLQSQLAEKDATIDKWRASDVENTHRMDEQERQLADLRRKADDGARALKDSERLDWLEKASSTVTNDEGFGDGPVEYFAEWRTGDRNDMRSHRLSAPSAREAIDKAMEAKS